MIDRTSRKTNTADALQIHPNVYTTEIGNCFRRRTRKRRVFKASFEAIKQGTRRETVRGCVLDNFDAFGVRRIFDLHNSRHYSRPHARWNEMLHIFTYASNRLGRMPKEPEAAARTAGELCA